MCAKKKGGSTKSFRFAGEIAFLSNLSADEESAFSQIFPMFQGKFISESPYRVPAQVRRTREIAARVSIPFFRQKFNSYSPRDITGAVSTAVTLPLRLTDECTSGTRFLLGAAIWLLDYTQINMLDELGTMLPAEPDDSIEYETPVIDDIVHPHETILRMLTLLTGRKEKYRKSFEQVIALIDRDDAAFLRAMFRDSVFDFFSRFIEVYTRVKPEPLEPFPDLMHKYSPFPFETPTIPFPSPEQSHPDLFFLLKGPSLIGASKEKIKQEFHNRRMIDSLYGFSVPDPYAICAAYLLLEREGDTIIDLNFLTAMVAICAERQLPWGYDEPVAWGITREERCPEYCQRYLYNSADRPSSEPCDTPMAQVDEGFLVSEPQLFYLATGYALPRDRVPSEQLISWFERQGVSETRSRELAYGAMLVSAIDDRPWDDSWEPQFSEAPDVDESFSNGEADSAPDDSESTNISAVLRSLKELRHTLHESERSIRELQDRLHETEKRNAHDREELHQLRDTLYRMKSDEPPQDEELDSEIELPFRVERRLLVFGGHETWLKTIRPLLPGARFFDRETLADLNAVRGADVIWIQPNALSHKFYYRVIDTARKYEIPVRYFAYASARKCAIQLVMSECSSTEK